ncbi:MAG: TonB family protein [Verrucomicrobia bacterium]|nr:TonB family protein [Verrucomicrobiota bacterium]
MKLQTTKSTLLSFLVLVLVTFIPGIASGIDNFESLKTLSRKLPGYPIRMTYEGIYEGSSRVVVHVNEKGELVDVYLEAYSHPEFGRLAEKYVKLWTFQPAKLNGEPLSVIKSYDFDFEDKRGVFAVGVQEAVAAKLNFARFAEKKRIYSPDELDQIPVPIEMVAPLFPEEFKGSDVEGSATVIFYIDENGNIRMPHVTEFSHESFGQVAIMAVEQWKFEAPTVKGKPVAIMASQKFDFIESSK